MIRCYVLIVSPVQESRSWWLSLFQQLDWKNKFLPQVHSYCTDPDYDCKHPHAHTQTLTQMYMHIVFRHTQQRKNDWFLWKKTTTSNSEIKCYTFCKMFHNSLYWFKWLGSVHTQPAAIVPHLMLMNACCMDTSCIIPFIWVSVDFSMTKKWMMSIFIPWEQIFGSTLHSISS